MTRAWLVHPRRCLLAALMTAAVLLVASPAHGNRARERGRASTAFGRLVRGFADPPAWSRPKFRWWWAAPLDLKEVATEVNAMAGVASHAAGTTQLYGLIGPVRVVPLSSRIIPFSAFRK